jgi:hypothetical protein
MRFGTVLEFRLSADLFNLMRIKVAVGTFFNAPRDVNVKR